MEKVAIYVRVSTSKQADDGNGLDAQINGINEYCLRKNYTYKPEHVYIDSGKSAKNLKRSAYIKLAYASQMGEFKKIITFKRDRLIRDVMDLNRVHTNLVIGCGITIETVRDGIIGWSNAMDEFIQTILTAKDKHEIIVTSERTKECMRALAKKGNYPFKGCPLGYVTERDHNNKKVLLPDMEKVEDIKYAFNFATNEDLSVKDIASHFSSKRLLDKRWTIDTLQFFIKNRIYSGDLITSSFTVVDFIEPIISRELQDKAMLCISKRKRANFYKYIYRNVVYCEACDVRLVNESSVKKLASGHKKIYFYYRCPSCASRVRENEIDKAIGKSHTNKPVMIDTQRKRKVNALMKAFREVNDLHFDGLVDESFWIEELGQVKKQIVELSRTVSGKMSYDYHKLTKKAKREWVCDNLEKISVDPLNSSIIVTHKKP